MEAIKIDFETKHTVDIGAPTGVFTVCFLMKRPGVKSVRISLDARKLGTTTSRIITVGRGTQYQQTREFVFSIKDGSVIVKPYGLFKD